MVRTLAVELAKKKIRVNAVAPGIIETDMTSELRHLLPDELRRHIPLGRFGEPEEIARAVRFLASDDASYITGEVLGVHGGLGS
jgi:3-oxoacyl-[acyl-carrier protein] reductase